MDKEKELLKYAVENGIIDLSYVREKYDMKKRAETLKKHPHTIWQGKDGQWRTYITDSCGKRKLLKKKAKRDLEDVVIAHIEQLGKNSFRDRFDAWVDRQARCGRSANTIYKYQADYKRFFLGSRLEGMDIRSITDEDICEFLTELLDSKGVYWRALNGMFGYLKGVFDKSIMDKLITENPCRYVDIMLFRKMCKDDIEKTAGQRTLSRTEMAALVRNVRKEGSMAKYAVEFSVYTGMRVGEIAALQWDDVDFEEGVIQIRHSEKYNKFTHEYTIEGTKTGKQRTIPMTTEIKKLLFRARDRQIAEGCYSTQFVFTGKNGRLHASTISNCARKNTSSCEFTNRKSIHAIRRTFNSNMRCMGVSPTVAASLLGHTAGVNERNYTYDTSNMDTKRDIMEKVITG